MRADAGTRSAPPALRPRRRSAWAHSSREAAKRKTLSKYDVQLALSQTEYFDFLVEIVGRPGEAPTQPSITET